MKQIDIFPWNEHFNTGIREIDKQHQRLVHLLNLLANRIVFQSDMPALGIILDELAEYAAYHFQTEEVIWHQYLADDALERDHKKSHEDFIATVRQLKTEETRQGDSLLEDVLSFLIRWLASHILQSDRYLALVVQAVQAGMPQEYAKSHARQQMNVAATALIDIILTIYDKLSSNALDLRREIAERERSKEALIESQIQLRSVIDSTSDLIWSVDAKRFGLVMFNRSLRDYFLTQRGIRIEPGMRPEELFPTDALIKKWRGFYQRTIDEGSHSFEYVTFAGARTLYLSFNPLEKDHEIYGVSVFGKDITARKAAEESAHQLAFYDPLTDLPNRRLLLDRLRQMISASARRKTYDAVLFIDLDNFKALNDTRGHDVGDLLLIEVADRLQASVRQGDTVARLGGDEFVITLTDLGDQVDQAIGKAETVSKKILETTSRTILLNGAEYHGTSSIGVCLFRGDDVTVDELLKHADTAMYQAKNGGRNTVRFYDPAMQATLESRVRIESLIRQALPDQFVLNYQLQAGRHGEVLGAEALLRWQHPEQGTIPPATFIPLAEDTGLILPIGEWVLRTACAQLKAWESDPKTRSLRLAVNVSVRQFHQADFVDRVLAALDDTAADPTKLKLELTESLLVKDVEDVIAKMSALKARGVTFSLDDFGTGYSSLSYLKRLPLDELKIDRSFVRDVLTDPDDASIALTIVALAKSLGLSVIAEGVETEAQRDFLARHGCNRYQGYLFSRPLPLDEFEQLLLRIDPAA